MRNLVLIPISQLKQFNVRYWRVDDHRHLPMAVSSLQFNLFGDAQRVIDFDAEISYRTLKFGVAKQDWTARKFPVFL